MKRDLKKEVTDETVGNNPFVLKLRIPVNTLVSDKYWEKTKDENGNLIVAPADLELEKTPYCKVFVDAKRRVQVSKLSARAKDLLIFVMYEVEVGKDYVWIPKARYMKENGVLSVNTYKSALKELILEGFLVGTAFASNGWYFINPDLFFNGSRVNKFPNNLVKK
jgi:hypothetical protein